MPGSVASGTHCTMKTAINSAWQEMWVKVTKWDVMIMDTSYAVFWHQQVPAGDGDDDYDNDDSKCKVKNLTDFIISCTNMCYTQFLGSIALSTANL